MTTWNRNLITTSLQKIETDHFASMHKQTYYIVSLNQNVNESVSTLRILSNRILTNVSVLQNHSSYNDE